MKVFVWIFLMLIGFQAQSQSLLDSLFSVWTDTTVEDSKRADSFIDYIYEGYFYSQPESTAILVEDLIQFTEKNGYNEGLVDALELAGYNSYRLGDYQKALAQFQRGLDLSEEINYQEGMAAILMKTGYIYHDNEDIVQAIKYYQRSLKIYEEIDDLSGISSIYNEFGSIYRDQQEYEKSLDYYERSIAINTELGDTLTNAAMYLNIGSLYLEKDDYPTALEYFEKALKLDQQTQDQLGIATGLGGIGNVYRGLGDDKSALDYLQRSLSISYELGDSLGIIATLLDLADIYLDKRDYQRSIENCSRSLSMARNLGDIGYQESANEGLYLAYKAIGRIKEALFHHEQMLVFADSIQTVETIKNLQQMEFSKQMLADSLLQVEKAMKVEMAHREEVQKLDKNRKLFIAGGLFFLVLSIGFYSRWRFVRKSKELIEKEKERSDSLLLNILPAAIAEELKDNGSAEARDFDIVSILFSDFKGFTEKSEQLSAQELIEEINQCFKAFDLICEKYKVEKIKTIGDAYMAAGGLPIPSPDSIQNTVLAALEMQAFIAERKATRETFEKVSFDMRLGIHTGPVVAGIVGVKKFQYDIWGDTVNIASRMESNGEIGKVNISQSTYEFLKGSPLFLFEPRGKVKVKGKGELDMWFVQKSPQHH